MRETVKNEQESAFTHNTPASCKRKERGCWTYSVKIVRLRSLRSVFEIVQRRAEVPFAVARDDDDDPFAFAEFFRHF